MMPCYGSCRMRRQCLSCVLVLLVFLACVQSQAPGDGDPFCTQLSEAVTPPAYPSNSRILMDSFHYLQLLSPVSNIPSAWQQVDVDDIISSTAASTEVSGRALPMLGCNVILLFLFPVDTIDEYSLSPESIFMLLQNSCSRKLAYHAIHR